MNHPGPEFLLRAIDDELSTAERIELEDHLTACAECRQSHREMGALSIRLEGAVSNTSIAVRFGDRLELQRRLSHRVPVASGPRSASRLLRWTAAAAALAAAVIVPKLTHRASGPAHSVIEEAGPETFEVDGETFTALPYSNPELPIDTARIVEMQVPVSSLTEAGILSGPLTPDAGDRSVLADVLLGADGEPRAVHVLPE